MGRRMPEKARKVKEHLFCQKIRISEGEHEHCYHLVQLGYFASEEVSRTVCKLRKVQNGMLIPMAVETGGGLGMSHPPSSSER